MRELKATPGPWLLRHDENWNNWSVISDNKDDRVEREEHGVYYAIAYNIGGHVLGDDYDDFTQVISNAHLIAAAPELYEALVASNLTLKRLMTEGHCNAYDKVVVSQNDAALAKARGEA